MSRSTLGFALALLLSAAVPACAVNMDRGTDDETTTDESDEITVSKGRFETFVGQDGKHYFHLLAGNGEKVLASEGYQTKLAAEGGIKSVQAHGTSAGRYEVRLSTTGEAYVVLVATNGQVIAVGERYDSKSNAVRAVTTITKVVAATVVTAAAPSGAKFQLFKGIDGQHYFHVRAANGAIVLQSEGYTTKAAATNGIDSVRANGKSFSRYEVLPAINGQFYFVLRATNGQVIANGETYSSKWNAEQAVRSVLTLLAGNPNTAN